MSTHDLKCLQVRLQEWISSSYCPDWRRNIAMVGSKKTILYTHDTEIPQNYKKISFSDMRKKKQT
jgi:hypothetical protein